MSPESTRHPSRSIPGGMRCFGAVRELRPGSNAETDLLRAVGTVRFAYNLLLADTKQQVVTEGKWPSVTAISLHTRWRSERPEWHREVSKECGQYGAERLALAFANFFASKNGKRAGRPVGFPSFRQRGHNDSVKFTAAKLRADGKHVHLPRVGDVTLKESLTLTQGQRVTAVTVRQRAGRWFATFHIREDDWSEPVKRTGPRTVGVDLGIGERFATLSDGTVIDNPRFFRTDAAKLRRASKSVSRKQLGSSNRAKAVKRLGCVHHDIANRRKDFIHKITTDLVKNHDEIVLEDLAVGAMGRTLRLGKSVHDAAMGEFRRQVHYKCAWYGTTETIVSRWFPSSRQCSACGEVNASLTLNDRTWTCLCGTAHDRDVNAAVNLQSMAVSPTVAACGEEGAGRHLPVEPSSVKQERSAQRSEDGVSSFCESDHV